MNSKDYANIQERCIQFKAMLVLTVVYSFCTFAALCLALPARAAPRDLSGWITTYDNSESFKPLENNLTHYETLWLFGSSVQGLIEKPESWWVKNQDFATLESRAPKANFFVGPVLHNSTEKGFDPNLGLSFFKSTDKVLASLKLLIKQHHWTALNIDFESLPAASAEDFEKFLRKLRAQFKGLKISVCLHAQVPGSPVYEGAQFQRWNQLKKIDVEFVVMAYDYSWATSKPGAIAPADWVRKVSQYAIKVFGVKKVIIALPLYGYHWSLAKDGVSWLGVPDIFPNLQKKVVADGWKQETGVLSIDGSLYRRGNQEVVSFDSEKSFKEKRQMLKKIGVRRFALWRIGAESDFFYKIKE